MFITDELIYIQMPKTACTHIALLLSKVFDGEQIGKHNAASDDQINSNSFFVSSIRNPWDWYLSLWTFGAQGNRGLVNQLTERHYRTALRRFFRKPLQGLSLFLQETTKNVSVWRDVYNDSMNIESFRKWLRLVHTPNNARWLGEGYERTDVGGFCGFMSYRYLYLCCSEPHRLYTPNFISNYNDLIRFEKMSCYIDFFIRQEYLEEDFCRVIERIRPLTREEKDEIFGAKKTNTSSRPLTISDYYDKESIDLISSRDRLLIEKFNYAPPKIAEQ